MNYDAIKESLARLVRSLTARFEYQALRAAKVVAQNDDYTLELVPEDEAWPGMSRVPIRTGIPGCRFRVRAGARVFFTFEGADSTRPLVTEWDEAGVDKVIFKAGIVDLRDEKGRSIACNGDLVMIPTTKGLPVQFVMPNPLGGLPVPQVLTVMSTSTPPAPIGTVVLPPMMAVCGSPPGFMILGQVISVSPNKS